MNKTIIVWLVAAFFFFCEYFLRISPSIMLPLLMTKYQVGAAMIGVLTSAFYYPYVLMQVPVGVITDRYGPTKILGVMSFLCAISCFLFASTANIYIAIFSRVIMGFCAAFAFVGSLRIVLNGLSEKHFTIFAGLTQGAGMLGAIFGDAPLNYYVHAVGVYTSMLSFALLFLLIALFFYQATDVNKSHYQKDFNCNSILQQLLAVISNKKIIFNGLFIASIYAPVMILGESWGPSFTSGFRNMTMHQAGLLTSCIFVGMGLGCFIYGFLNKTYCKIKIMRISALISSLATSIIIYIPGLSLSLLVIFYFLFGFVSASIVTSYAYAADKVSGELKGTALGFTNMMCVALGALMAPIVGFKLSLAGVNIVHSMHAVTVFQHTFIVLPFLSLFCYILTHLMDGEEAISIRAYA